MTRARAEDLVVFPTGLARYRGRLIPCSLGRAGVTAAKREGDGATPRGVFEIEQIYYRADRRPPLRTLLPIRPIGPGDGWSDDPDDPAYNQRIRRPSPWRCETMRRADPMYDCIGVLTANRRPVIPGAGSAIFLHVWRGPRRPTAGCVAFERSMLEGILESWTPRARVIVT